MAIINIARDFMAIVGSWSSLPIIGLVVDFTERIPHCVNSDFLKLNTEQLFLSYLHFPL